MVLLLVRFVDESTGFLAPASVEDFRADLEIGYATAAAMFVTYGIGGVVGNLAVAASDGHSRKPVTIGGAAFTALALAVLAGATAGWMMLLGTGLIAVGSTMLVHGGEIATTNLLQQSGLDHELERVLARGNLGAVAGDLLAPLVLTATRAAGVEWRWVFSAAAVMVVAYGVGLVFVRFPSPSPAPADGPEDGARPAPIRRQQLVWLLGFGAFVAMPLDEAYLSVVLADAESVRGWSGAEAAALGAAFVAGGLIAFTVLPRFVARVDLATLMVVTGLGMFAVMVVVAVGPGWLVPFAGVAHSTLLGGLWLGEQAAVLRANPGREGRTKLVVEVCEGTSLAAVWLLGLLADSAGVRASLWAYAVLPLGLLAVAGRLRAVR